VALERRNDLAANASPAWAARASLRAAARLVRRSRVPEATSAGKRCFTLGCGDLSSGSYVRTTAKALAPQKERPRGPTRGKWSLANVAGRPEASRSGAEGAAFLDTEGLTQRGSPRDRHNSTAKRLRALTPRSEWLEQVCLLTTVVREQSARKLDARGRALALDRRRLWRDDGMADRSERSGRPIGDTEGAGVDTPISAGGRVLGMSRALAAACRRAADIEHESPEERADREDREQYGEPRSPRSTQWHASRAKNKRELFGRVAKCGTEEGTKVTIVCRDCKTKTEIDVGCGSRWFCPKCRVETVKKFRGDFERKRLGLLTTAARAGLTRRRQERSKRWGERMLTLTLPHVGNATDRIDMLCETWNRFFRLLRDRLRPSLQDPSGITVDELPRASSPNGVRQRDELELSLWDLFTYLRVLEWTPGADGDGHPHFHVWIFSRFLDKDLLHALWTRAYYEVRRARLAVGPIQEIALIRPFIQECKGSPAAELIKYLTKDWEINDSGARRASPAVFSSVYARLDGKRLRQSSARFADWAVNKFNACPCCWFEKANGDSWARIDITHSLEEVKDPIGREYDPADNTAAPLVGAGRYDELRDEFEQKRDADWAASLELRILRARVRAALQLPEKRPRPRHQQLTLGDHQYGKRNEHGNDGGERA
jgi:hypothetical protein